MALDTHVGVTRGVYLLPLASLVVAIGPRLLPALLGMSVTEVTYSSAPGITCGCQGPLNFKVNGKFVIHDAV